MLIVLLSLTFNVMAQEKIDLRVSWWGSEVRNNATLEAIELYERLNPHINIIPEYQGFEGYRTKLLAQAAAGDAPDIYTTIVEWYPDLVDADAMADITGMVDVSGHNHKYVEACSVDGKMYGVNLSVQALIMIQNATLLEELGIEPLEAPYSYEDMANKYVEIYEKSDGTVYGSVDVTTDSVDGSGMHFLTYYGYSKLSYDTPFPYDNEQFTFTKEDINDYFQYYAELRENNGVAPVDLSSVNDHAANSLLVNRMTVYEIMNAGTFEKYQGQMEDNLDMIPLPLGPDGKSGEIARPGLAFTVAKNTEHKEEAAKFIDWFTNSPEAAVVLGNCRGTLPTTVQREALIASGKLSAIDVKVNEVVNFVLNNREMKVAYSGPQGTPELQHILPEIGQMLAYDRITLDEAVEMFVEEAWNLDN